MSSEHTIRDYLRMSFTFTGTRFYSVTILLLKFYKGVSLAFLKFFSCNVLYIELLIR